MAVSVWRRFRLAVSFCVWQVCWVEGGGIAGTALRLFRPTTMTALLGFEGALVFVGGDRDGVGLGVGSHR